VNNVPSLTSVINDLGTHKSTESSDIATLEGAMLIFKNFLRKLKVSNV
jgi:hypothetical protein